MAKARYREANMVKWVGVRPGHNGTQIATYTEANNGTVVAYTVPANTVFLWTAYSCWFHNTSGAASTGYCLLYKPGPTAVYRILTERVANNESGHSTQEFYFPIECEAAWYFQLVSGAANARVQFSIHGFEIDA